MQRQFIYPITIILMMVCFILLVSGQETNVALSNKFVNNSSANQIINITRNTSAENNLLAGFNATIPANDTIEINSTANRLSKNFSTDETLLLKINDLSLSDQAPTNLSTKNNTTNVITPISKMANKAPVLAATASSVQKVNEPAGTFKIGKEVGGEANIFQPKHDEVEPYTIALQTKPMVDTGKIFFVCDIV